jgi:tetratricopeptide (TPR) repeat protein
LATSADTGAKGTFRALAFRASGDQSRAVEMGRAALPLIDGELKKTPDDGYLWKFKALLLAILGERKLAFAALGKAVAAAEPAGNFFYIEDARRKSLDLHALLGERKEALEELSRQLKLPGSRIHDLRVNLALASLWDDPSFKAMVNDPANNAPLPFDARQSPATPK